MIELSALQKQSKYHAHVSMWIIPGVLLCSIIFIIIFALYRTDKFFATKSTVDITTIAPLKPTNSLVSYCAGISSYTLWKLFSTNEIMMNINTSNCNFSSIPFYFTSINGTSSHWVLNGYGAIYSPTINSFTIYAYPVTNLDNIKMLNYSQMYKWDVNWLGVSH